MRLHLAYREFGSGAPIIILHGLMGSKKNWWSIAKKLSDSYHVFTLDARNHGDSPHAGTMSYEEMAQDVVEFMDRRHLEKPFLLGHSMGGKTAMVLALKYPLRVEQLIVADVAPVTYSNNYHALLHILQTVDLQPVKQRNEVEFQLQNKIPDPLMRGFLLKNLSYDGQHFQWKINLNAIEQAISDLQGFPLIKANSHYPGKTLFIGGDLSDYLKPQYYSSIFKWFPDNRMVMLQNAGHWVHVEQPASFLQSVYDFI
ncbi:MAG: alpha/beta fold hydrolase [SAR324 cluster bacterium]|nr:alpha/beta fold hydrolase [SAR324 cluster bacterium]